MSWKDRATKVDNTKSSWKDRAKVVPVKEESILDKEIPYTPFFDPTLRELGEPLAEPTQTLLDGAAGVAQGATMGTADEIGAIASTGLDSLVEGVSGLIPGTDQHKLNELESKGFEFPEQSLAEKYKMYQDSGDKGFKEAEERSPWMYGAGDLAGGIGSSVALGAKLGVNAASKAPKILDIMKDKGKLKAGLELLKRGGTNFVKASPLMALEGVTRSDGNLIGGTDEEQMDVLSDAGGSLAFGLPAMLGMQGVSDVIAPAAKGVASDVANYASKKADDILDNSPLVRQGKKIFEYGKNEGINPASEKASAKLFDNETTQSKNFLTEIMDADSKLGQDVGNSLQRAEKAGVKFNINPTIDSSFAQVAKSYETMEDISKNSRGRDIFNRIANKSSQPLSPLEAKALLDDVDTMISKVDAIKYTSQTEKAIFDNLTAFRKNLSEQMKEGIPQYRQAAERFTEWRQLVPETIISGKIPQDISNVYMGDLKNPDLKIFQKAEDLMTGTTGTGQGSIPIKQAFSQMKQGMSQFEGNEAKRLADAMKNGASAEDLAILKNPMMRNSEEYARIVRDNSDDAIARRALMSSEESRSLGSNLITAGTGIGQASKSKFLYGVNVAGRVAGSNAVKTAGQKARYVYNLPAEKLNASADKMMQMPGLKTLGKALKDGLADPNQAKKNTVLFMIMQHPEASLFFNSEHGFMNEENEE